MGSLKEIEPAIAEYLSLKWDLLWTTGKQPSCGRTRYVQRNAARVRRSLAKDAEYLKKQYAKLGLGEESNVRKFCGVRNVGKDKVRGQ